MGCDIHITAERKVGDKYEAVTESVFPYEYGNDGFISAPFDWRSYGMFGFLADVRNYAAAPPIAPPRGWPDDASKGANEEYEQWSGDAHTPSWLSVAELSAFDYDQPVEDRRVRVQLGPNTWSGAGTAEPGYGTSTTWREFLGAGYFRDLDILQKIDADRVVFFFDN